MVDRVDVVVHAVAQGSSWKNQDEPGRQRCATTSPKTARPLRSTSRTPESAPRRCSRHSRSARRDGAAARPTRTTGSRALKWEAARASSQFTSHHAPVSTSTLMRCVPAWTTPWNPPPPIRCRRAHIVAELAPLMSPTQTDRDARWLRAARQAKALAWFSLAWMTGEGVLGLIAGITANSISLIGWALGSVIEGLASIIVIWRFTGSRTVSETSERRAQRAVAVSFFLLAPSRRGGVHPRSWRRAPDHAECSRRDCHRSQPACDAAARAGQAAAGQAPELRCHHPC